MSLGLGCVILFFCDRGDSVSDADCLHKPSSEYYLFLFDLYVFDFGFAFAGFLLYSILYLFIPKKKYYDFIIIPRSSLLNGEKVTPTY